jgi:hypothetical protein
VAQFTIWLIFKEIKSKVFSESAQREQMCSNTFAFERRKRTDLSLAPSCH